MIRRFLSVLIPQKYVNTDVAATLRVFAILTLASILIAIISIPLYIRWEAKTATSIAIFFLFSNIACLFLLKADFRVTARVYQFLVTWLLVHIASLYLGFSSALWLFAIPNTIRAYLIELTNEKLIRRFFLSFSAFGFIAMILISFFDWITPEVRPEYFSELRAYGYFNLLGAAFFQTYQMAVFYKEVKQLRATLLDRSAQMIQQAKLTSLGEMAGGLAHEINNPLMIIMGKNRNIGRLLSSFPPTEPTSKISSELSESDVTLKRMINIIKGMRDFAGASDNTRSSNLSVSHLVSQTLILCQTHITSRGVEVKTPYCPDETIIGKYGPLSQALFNLITNAMEAALTTSQPWIEVSWSQKGELIQIVVMDSGTGIPSEVQDKMYQPFFTTKPIGKGSGLGLSISKGLIEANQGRLFYDHSSKHTRFIIEMIMDKTNVIGMSSKFG